MNIRKHEYTVPIADRCTECGEPFVAGDSVTFDPPRHRACDPMATLVDDFTTRALADLSRALDGL